MSQPIAGSEVRAWSGYYDDSKGECRSRSEASAPSLLDGPLSSDPPRAPYGEGTAEGRQTSSAVEDLVLACQRLNAPPRAPLPPQAPASASCAEPVLAAVSSCLAVVGRVIVGAPSVAGAVVALAGGIACGVAIAKAHECLEKPEL